MTLRPRSQLCRPVHSDEVTTITVDILHREGGIAWEKRLRFARSPRDVLDVSGTPEAGWYVDDPLVSSTVLPGPVLVRKFLVRGRALELPEAHDLVQPVRLPELVHIQRNRTLRIALPNSSTLVQPLLSSRLVVEQKIDHAPNKRHSIADVRIRINVQGVIQRPVVQGIVVTCVERCPWTELLVCGVQIEGALVVTVEFSQDPSLTRACDRHGLAVGILHLLQPPHKRLPGLLLRDGLSLGRIRARVPVTESRGEEGMRRADGRILLVVDGRQKNTPRLKLLSCFGGHGHLHTLRSLPQAARPVAHLLGDVANGAAAAPILPSSEADHLVTLLWWFRKCKETDPLGVLLRKGSVEGDVSEVRRLDIGPLQIVQAAAHQIQDLVRR
mmetsp:Transcript_46538/g.149517  ORF Transcript_46538/g.149517 Transcript_46538/m.149517 type:complete len:385 (+) Transcript_46538:76-1230(+)